MNEGTRRVCPLLEREAPSAILPYAPEPWVLRRCLESGFVFLENPPRYEALKHDYAWEVTSRRQTEDRRAAHPVLHTLSAALKRGAAKGPAPGPDRGARASVPAR